MHGWQVHDLVHGWDYLDLELTEQPSLLAQTKSGPRFRAYTPAKIRQAVSVSIRFRATNDPTSETPFECLYVVTQCMGSF